MTRHRTPTVTIANRTFVMHDRSHHCAAYRTAEIRTEGSSQTGPLETPPVVLCVDAESTVRFIARVPEYLIDSPSSYMCLRDIAMVLHIPGGLVESAHVRIGDRLHIIYD